MSIFDGLVLPVKYHQGTIVDASGKRLVKAERNVNETPLSPAGRDALLKVLVVLLNEASKDDTIDRILKKLDYL